MSQWIRFLRCTVAGVVVKDLRMDFSVEKNLQGAPNTAKIRIYNLKKENRAKIKEEFKTVLLEGGYENGSYGTLHFGDVQTVDHKREGKTDIVTEIVSKDGGANHRFGYINKTFDPEETTPKNIILELHKRMIGINLGEIKGVDRFPPLRRPLTIAGTISNEMDVVCKKYDLYWSIQNGFLEVIPYDDYIRDVTLVNKETGMIGTPDTTELGVNVKTLLNHKVRPNRAILVESEDGSASGLFRVNKVVYSGNNHDGEFVNILDAARIEGGVRHEKYKEDQ